MHDKTERFIIDNLDRFIQDSRVLVFNIFGKNNKTKIDELSYLISSLQPEEVEELNSILSQKESEVIAKEFIKTQINKKTKAIRYTISNVAYQKMLESFNARMVNNLIHCMANKGMLETAYDEETNDFIFWIKDNENEKPETD